MPKLSDVSWTDILLWGFAATLFLTSVLTATQALGWTRMNINFILGTMWTPDRDRANVYGFVFHFINGWFFAVLYALFFESIKFATWWLGALMGLLHGFVVLAVLLPLLPGVHPRMVSEFAGPEPTRLLEPPGFFALNYGLGTPVATLIAHLGYGLILGIFYSAS